MPGSKLGKYIGYISTDWFSHLDVFFYNINTFSLCPASCILKSKSYLTFFSYRCMGNIWNPGWHFYCDRLYFFVDFMAMYKVWML